MMKILPAKNKREVQKLVWAIGALREQRLNPSVDVMLTASPSFVRDPVVYYGRCQARAGGNSCVKHSGHSGRHAAWVHKWVAMLSLDHATRPPTKAELDKKDWVLVEFPVLSAASRKDTWSRRYTAGPTSTASKSTTRKRSA